MYINDDISEGGYDIVNNFNEYFSSVASDLEEKIIPS